MHQPVMKNLDNHVMECQLKDGIGGSDSFKEPEVDA